MVTFVPIFFTINIKTNKAKSTTRIKFMKMGSGDIRKSMLGCNKIADPAKAITVNDIITLLTFFL